MAKAILNVIHELSGEAVQNGNVCVCTYIQKK